MRAPVWCGVASPFLKQALSGRDRPLVATRFTAPREGDGSAGHRVFEADMSGESAVRTARGNAETEIGVTGHDECASTVSPNQVWS